MATRSLSPRVPFHHDSLSQWQSVSILSGAAIMLSLAMGMRQSLMRRRSTAVAGY